jgi:predicted transcriptional regulator
MEVRLTPELENELASIAARSSRTPQQVAAEVLTRGLHQERRFIDSVEQGIASADAGRVIPDEDVLAWLHAQEARESS